MKNDAPEKEQKEDLRVVRTKRDLANALEELLQDRNFDDLGVKDITDKAMVAKNTFYNNFADKNELLHFLFERYYKELWESIEPTLEKSKLLPRLMYFKAVTKSIVHFFYTSSHPFAKMVQNDKSKAIFWNLSLFIREVLDEVWKKYGYRTLSKADEDVASIFYSGAFSSLLYFSFLGAVNRSEDELVKDITKLAYPIAQ